MSQDQKSLTVNHLRKLFSDLIRNQLSTADTERNLYKMLPLFHRVANICSSDELIGQFKEFYHFTSHMSKLFVSEVKKRAANQSTEIAAQSIADFLSPEVNISRNSPIESSAKPGWQLLNCLKLLISTNNQLVSRAMSEANLPSTLAKSLYLFYDLPEIAAGDDSSEGRRARMCDSFVELSLGVAGWGDCAEEMCRRDDLSLLLTALSGCFCPRGNLPFRQATSQVLMTIASRSLTPLVLAYLHNKNLVDTFLTNLKVNSGELSVAQMVDTLVCLFCLLKDSATVTAELLNDLKVAGGYQFLQDFILRNELDSSQECQDALRNLLLMLASFVTVGYGDFPSSPPPVNSLYYLPNFIIPTPVGPGVTARNSAAFAVLQSLFIKSQNEAIGSCILDVISSVYSADPANYFLLDNLCTLGQFAEVIFTRSHQLQVKFYDLLEYVVFHLNFVPCRELIALSVSLKTQTDSESAVVCIHSLFKILSCNGQIFRDVYREVGLLEAILHICRQFCSHLTLRKPEMSDSGRNLALLSIDLLTLLIKSNPTNASIFRELNGQKSIETLIGCEESRLAALQVVQQLLLIPGSDDELTSLLGLIHSAKSTDIQLKSQILKSLLYVLRESHRVRLIFRRVGGFLYVISTLVTLEGALGPDCDRNTSDLLELIRLTFKVITVAMRFEPANARFFEVEVRYSSLTESLRLLGCFNAATNGRDGQLDLADCHDDQTAKVKEFCQQFGKLFHSDSLSDTVEMSDEIPMVLRSICLIIRMLYDMALDNYEKPQLSRGVTIDQVNYSKTDNNNVLAIADCLVVHPGAVSSILHLLPAIASDDNPIAALSLQIFVLEVMKSLVRSERNQQVTCEFGLPRELFQLSSNALKSAADCPDHPLLPPLYYMIERLAAQSMQPRELREFLRLESPLCCQNLDDADDSETSRTAGGPVRLSRVKTLVSMMTPRDYRLAGVSQSPPFVEFDMSVEGFGCIFLPSIAPQSQLMGGVQLSSVVPTVGGSVGGGGMGAVEGGLGLGDRIFPPLTGLSLLMWIYTERFSDAPTDSHPIRLLTVVRSAADRKNPDESGSGPELACLTLQISPIDRALLISTDESNTPGADLDQDSSNSDYYQRLLIPELRVEQQWCHLAVVFSRAVLKNSTVSIYLNGQLKATEKIHYVIQNLGGAATTLTSASSINAIIGTPPGPLRKQSQLQWRLGTTHLLEDSCQPQFIQTAFRLGPHYTGNFQCCALNSGLGSSLISEERVIFALNGQSVSQLTVAKMRKIYNKFDSKLIAKLLGLSSHENATPIRLLHNSSAHLNGPARSIGGVLVGYLGMRTFCPRPVSKLLESVGGISALLGLVAMAVEGEGLYAAIKALLCGVRSNANMAAEMNRTRGYQTLAVLLKEKSNLLNSHILHLIFSLVGTLDSCRDSTSIPNIQAFDDLLCNLELWRITSSDLQRLLFEHFYELITESGDQQKANLTVIRALGLLGRLLKVIRSDPDVLLTARDVLFNLLAAILQPLPDPHSLLKFGQFIASTLPNNVVGSNNGGGDERQFPMALGQLQQLLFPASKLQSDANVNLTVLRNLYLRNRCLAILLNMLVNTGGAINYQLCDLVVRTLGFDWVVQLFTEDLHDGTVALGLRILSALMAHQPLMAKFKEGQGSGGWLTDSESVVQNRAGVLLGFSVSCYGGSVGAACDVNPEICHLPGFTALSLLAPNYAHLADVYLTALSILVGQPAKDLPFDTRFDLDSVWTRVFHIPVNHSVADGISRVELCCDAVTVLLALVKRCLNTPSTESWAQQYPLTLLQFLTFLYHNISEFTQFCMTEEFVTGLIGTLFPETPNFSPTATKAVAYDSTDTVEIGDETTLVVPTRSTPVVSVTDHPAKKSVLDLIRNILVDSFPLPANSNGNSVTDVIIEMAPEWPVRLDTSAYVTAVLQAATDHLLASDALLHGQSASLPAALVVGSNFGTLAANIFYFTGRLVDSLWTGLFIGDSQNVFQFIIKLISQGKRKGGIALDSLFRSLNRTILFMLSRSMDTISARNCILDTLHKVTAHRGLIFAQLNVDLEFFACLSHLLFLLTMSEPHESDQQIVDNSDEAVRIRESSVLIANSARRVWEEMYVTKKQSLEEQLKTPLVPEINAARSLVGESVNRLWQTYLDGEMKGSHSIRDSSVQLHTQLQSKIQKMAGGLSRLASRKAIRPQSTYKSPTVTYQTLTMWMGVHRSLIRELVRLQHLHSQQSTEHVEKFVLEDWRSVEQELTRERGLWGPNKGSVLDKWVLDSTEGPYRMRKKLIQNEIFYIHYPFRPNLDLADFKPLKYKVAVSKDSRLYYERMRKKRAKTLDSRIYDVSTTVATPSEEKPFLLRDLKDLNPSLIRRFSFRHETSNSQTSQEGNIDETESTITTTNSSGIPSSIDSQSITESIVSMPDASETAAEPRQSIDKGDSSAKGPDNQTLLRLLEEGEELQSMFRCARVNGLDTREGLLLFGKEHYYVVDGYTLLKTREIRDLDFLPEELHDPIIPYTACGGAVRIKGLKRICSKFPYEDVREVHKRRYLLQPIALEVFSADGRNNLLAFPKKMRNKVYTKFLSVAKSITDTDQSVSGQKSSANVEAAGGLLSNLMGETSVTQRWVRGEISNFQYLMALNTLAGRSYNDLMQYPVFPWILADYDSEELDLTDPQTFRELWKPMGAQNGERLEQFLKRYREWDDPTGETPPYMYGTHYSSAMIVVSYLVRVEPFTQHFLKLQGGHFDLADRMFHSIRELWISASRNNMADVKELIPEFFYLPDFLLNSNNFDFGAKQSGVPLGDVILPPWAKDSPREFIRIHREALESDFISAHLHEWIDLIFGYKQTGPAAIEANNLFHHLFYEGNVDFEAIDDPLTRAATIGFINNFGQIPTQLFKRAHPAKKLKLAEWSTLSTRGVTTDRFFYHSIDSLKPPTQPIKELKGAVGQIVQTDKGQILAVEQNKVAIPPGYQKYLAWGFADQSLRLGTYDTDKSSCILEMSDCAQIVCATCPNNRTVITGGTSTVISVWDICNAQRGGGPISLRLRKSLYGHVESISCLTSNGTYGLIVSGSQDRTAIIWDLSSLAFIRQLSPHPSAVSAVAINENTGDMVTASGTDLFLWSINGVLVAKVNTATSPKVDTKQLILAVCFSTGNDWDPQHVIVTGSNDGVVRIWSCESVQLPLETGVETTEESNNSAVDHKEFSPDALRLRLLRDGRLNSSEIDSTGQQSPPGGDTFSPQNGSDSGLDTPILPPPRCSSSDPQQAAESQSIGDQSIINRQGSTESFVLINKDGLAVVRTPNRLRSGFQWRDQLVFRSKLTLHTAIDRKDNPTGAPITALSTTKDNKSLLVGDGRGRVWQWPIGEPTGGRVDHWVLDTSKQLCYACGSKFSFSDRRHHCRNCGQIFCAKCSRFESEIKSMKIRKPVRVCQQCYLKLKTEEN